MNEGNIISKATDTVANARKTLDDISASAIQNATAAQHTIKESYKGAKEAFGDVVDGGANAAKATKGYVEAHPWLALGAGVAVGVLLASMARRR